MTNLISITHITSSLLLFYSFYSTMQRMDYTTASGKKVIWECKALRFTWVFKQELFITVVLFWSCYLVFIYDFRRSPSPAE